MKIFVLGAGPLPERGKIANAGGLRTAQFLEKIISTKGISHVEVITLENEEKNEIEPKKEKKNGVEVRQKIMAKDDPLLLVKIKKIIKKENPNAVFGVNVFPSFVAAKCIPPKTPFWADLNGWIIAERQIQAVSSGTNDFLADAWEKEKTILLRADSLSVVSLPQKYVTIGEMAALGLLTRENVEFRVEVVENTCRPLHEEEKKIYKDFQYRGIFFPENAFAILWIGGMNAWADESVLFSGLENAMKKCPHLHFVMTGESLLGIDEKQFPTFREKAEKSAFRERFHFLGWRKAEEMPALFQECDIGINIDRWCPETEIGARNRLNEFLRFGLPIISTGGSEIAEKIRKTGAGIVLETRDPQELSEVLEKIQEKGDFLEKMGYNGAKMAEELFLVQKTTKTIEKFLQNPKRIPKISPKGNLITAGICYLRNRGVKAFLKKCRQKITEKIGF